MTYIPIIFSERYNKNITFLEENKLFNQQHEISLDLAIFIAKIHVYTICFNHKSKNIKQTDKFRGIC